MRTKYEIERINARLDKVERDIKSLKKKTGVVLCKDDDEFVGSGDFIIGQEMGWRTVSVNKIVKLIFNHLNLKYIPESTVPESVVKKSK